jgi:hypothetical protein
MTFAIDATATFPIPPHGAPADLSVDDLLAHPLTLSTQDVIERTGTCSTVGSPPYGRSRS